MNKLLALLLFSQFAMAGTAPTSFKTDTLEFGKPATGDKTLNFKRSTGSAQPGFKWNEGASAMQFSNDGSTYTSFLTTATVDTSSAIVNGGLTAATASNALTINITGKSAATPSPSNQVLVSFRNISSFPFTASYTQVALSSALSITVPSGASLGHVSGASENVWVYLLNDAGTIDVCVLGERFVADHQLVGTLFAVTQISAGSTSRNILYCAGSHAGGVNYATRLYGRVFLTESTAGVWASTPTLSSATPLPVIESSQTFTTSGPQTFIVPRDVHKILVRMCGAGGGGGGGSSSQGGSFNVGGGGGGAGTALAEFQLDVIPGESLGVNIGAGGTGGTPTTITSTSGTVGGDTTITRSGTTIAQANGGDFGFGGSQSPSGSGRGGRGGGNPVAPATNAGVAGVLYQVQGKYYAQAGGNGSFSAAVSGAGGTGNGFYSNPFTGGNSAAGAGARGAGGGGGSSFFGNGGNGGAAASAGTNATGNCAGGGGAGSENTGSNGSPGLARIYWVSP